MSFLQQALVYLAAAVLAVPLFNRLKLGSVLGYLIAGALIGPGGLALIDDFASVLHFSELGVVMLLFLIGLELQPSRLWALRKRVFGLGGLQLALTTPLLGGGAMLLGLPVATAMLVGAGLSLSSTAFALQLLGEKNQLGSPYGQSTFGILLFQDLAVIPLLAVLPLMGNAGPVAHEPWWLGIGRVLGVLAVVGASKFVLQPVLRIVAAQRSQELFTAAALLLVVGAAVAVSAVGLSMALGAFLAGVLLADSDYRTELETDIQPFKGLLLGLFFIAVGMSVNLQLVLQRPVLVAICVAGLVLIKAAVLGGMGLLNFKDRCQTWRFAFIISQGGEFAFVLFRVAVGVGAMEAEVADLLVAVVTISMATTPLIFALLEAALPRGRDARPFDVSPEEASPVIIAGFGRIGQVVGRVLRAKRIGFTALDSSSEHIEFIRKFGANVFYGDASRLDLLRSAGAATARIMVVAIDDPDVSMQCVNTVQQHFPHIRIVARARNRAHAYKLMKAGIEHVIRETWAGSLEITAAVLQEAGLTYSDTAATIERFREHDEALIQKTYPHMDDMEKMRKIAMAAREELESLFNQDAIEERV